MWSVGIHRLVLSEDFKKIDGAAQRRIVRTIREKLSADPEGYGRPLRGDLAGYWKLRVGDHRVIYRIIRHSVSVLVIKVGARRDMEVYFQVLSRIRMLNG